VNPGATHKQPNSGCGNQHPGKSVRQAREIQGKEKRSPEEAQVFPPKKALEQAKSLQGKEVQGKEAEDAILITPPVAESALDCSK
jgi:hypothetical protein